MKQLRKEDPPDNGAPMYLHRPDVYSKRLWHRRCKVRISGQGDAGSLCSEVRFLTDENERYIMNLNDN